MPLLFATHTGAPAAGGLGGGPSAGGLGGAPQASTFVLLNSSETFFRVNYVHKRQHPERHRQQQPRQVLQQRLLQQQLVHQLQQQEAGDGIPCWFCCEGGPFECLLCCGPSPLDCHRQLHAALGAPLMPPISALGLHQSRWSYEDEVINKICKKER